MGRRPRPVSETGYYHIVTRGNQRQRVFREATDYAAYLQLLGVALASHGVALAHFCLMPNHTHLLLQAPEADAVSRALHQLQRRYWFYHRRSSGLTGHLWQGRFHSFPIADEAYLLTAARYIERNPLEARLILQLREYPWSSYPHYALGAPAPVPLTPPPTYDALADTALSRQQAYRRWVETAQPFDRSMRRTLQTATAYA